MKDKVYIVVVNWNGWRQTLECLESLFRQNYISWRVIVCDNASTDDSWEKIKVWADGHLEVKSVEDFPLMDFIVPGVPKPIPYLEYNREESESGGKPDEQDEPLVLIQTGENLGFSGGNNVALRYIQSKADYNYVWILNNDTIVRPDALTILVDKLNSDPTYGICGATVVYQHDLNCIQARGGNSHIAWLGQTRHVGFLESLETKVSEKKIEKKIDCVLGACMLVTKVFIRDVGLLSEIYFLYFEELDWALRARKYGYKLAYASQAVIYHKEGETLRESNRDRAEKSWTADYFEVRNRLVLTRKFYPWALPIVCLSFIITMANRVHRKQWKRIGMVCKAVIDAFKVRLDTT